MVLQGPANLENIMHKIMYVHSVFKILFGHHLHKFGVTGIALVSLVEQKSCHGIHSDKKNVQLNLCGKKLP